MGKHGSHGPDLEDRRSGCVTRLEWPNCANTAAMLEFLRGKASDRKLRLFAVDCCRRVRGAPLHSVCSVALNVAERLADDRLRSEDMPRTLARDLQVLAQAPARWGYSYWEPERVAARACQLLLDVDIFSAMRRQQRPDWITILQWGRVSQGVQTALLRELFGDLFGPVRLDPAWLAWNDACLVKMARAIYDEGRFGDLPILADALEEAGCADADILNHCRAASDLCSLRTGRASCTMSGGHGRRFILRPFPPARREKEARSRGGGIPILPACPGRNGIPPTRAGSRP